jgi:hypothetical protein
VRFFTSSSKIISMSRGRRSRREHRYPSRWKAAERTLPNCGLGGHGITGIDQQPERAASGRSSSSSSTRFALRLVTMKLMPVALLLGRLRLATTRRYRIGAG